jgi:hypothetical protein
MALASAADRGLRSDAPRTVPTTAPCCKQARRSHVLAVEATP